MVVRPCVIFFRLTGRGLKLDTALSIAISGAAPQFNFSILDESLCFFTLLVLRHLHSFSREIFHEHIF
jgi:hypothetical protein